MTAPVLAIVDDETDAIEILCAIAEAVGFECRMYTASRDFVRSLSAEAPFGVLLDIVMPEMDGIEVLNALKEAAPGCHVILMSGYGENYINMASLIGKGRGITVRGSFSKPINYTHLEHELLRLKREYDQSQSS